MGFFAVAQLAAAEAPMPSSPGPNLISGVPIVQDSGLMIIGGQKVALWGIDTLAPDQQCWQGETAWCCGEEATTALRHFVEGRLLECVVQHKAESGTLIAKCSRPKGHRARKDVAEQLVRQGWALDRGEASGGAYFAAEEAAQQEKRGIWGSRFQTAQDWRDGVQRFVGETPPAPPVAEGDATSSDEESEAE